MMNGNITHQTGEAMVDIKPFRGQVTSYSFRERFAILWMENGVRSIRIDMDCYPLQPNSIFFITPGKKAEMEYAGPPAGWVMTFTPEFFSPQMRENLVIKDVEIFESRGEIPRIVLSPAIACRINTIAEMINELLGTDHPHKTDASRSLFRTLLLYCDSHCNIRMTTDSSTTRLTIVARFKNLVSKHFHRFHGVSDYAEMLNISPKYLNQAVRDVLDVNAKQIIREQLFIQARRDLKFTDRTVKEIAYNLGFSDPFYFSNCFKKETGCSPSEYRNH